MTSCCRDFQCSLYIFLTFHIFKICIYVFSVTLKFCFFLWRDFNFIIKNRGNVFYFTPLVVV